MTVRRNCGKSMPGVSGLPRAVRVLAVSVGIATAAATLAAPAQADPVGDAFLSALNNAGVNYNDPGNTVALGESICPMLVQPGGSFASAASSITGNTGMTPAIAGLFTSIAISMYCPSMVNSFANGDFSNLPQIPGLPGVGSLAGIGIPGL
jgi:hypothetical protein